MGAGNTVEKLHVIIKHGIWIMLIKTQDLHIPMESWAEGTSC